MRNLKRVLSLALALVMVLGMMVIGTSAATFTDEESITYKEAVEVMNALGIVKGDGGEFNPERVLTREEAAKILAYVVLGPEVENYLSGSESPFTDVKSDRWSAKYIAFCKNAKYIHGETETTFNPKGQLTVVGFGKLLLGALGFDTTVYTGGGWIDAVAADMAKAGLDIVEFDAKTLIDRDTACQMALIAMQYGVETIEYVVFEDKIPTGETEGNGKYDKGEEILAKYDNARDAIMDVKLLGGNTAYDKLTDKETLLSSVYEVKVEGATDDFGRPGYTYSWGEDDDAVEMFYAYTPVAKFEGPVAQKDFFAAAKVEDKDAVEVEYSIIQDGVNIDAWGDWSADKAIKGETNDAAKFAPGTGYGIKSELYADAEGNYTLIAIREYLGEVVDVIPADEEDEESKRAIIVDLTVVPTGNETTTEIALETEEFAEEDMVIVTVAAGEIQTIALAETVKGTATKIVDGSGSSNNKIYTIAGEEYVLSQNASGVTVAVNGKDAEYYLDSMGNLIGKVYVAPAVNPVIYGIVMDTDGKLYIEAGVDNTILGREEEEGQAAAEVIEIMTLDGKKVIYNTDWEYLYEDPADEDKITGVAFVLAGEQNDVTPSGEWTYDDSALVNKLVSFKLNQYGCIDSETFSVVTDLGAIGGELKAGVATIGNLPYLVTDKTVFVVKAHNAADQIPNNKDQWVVYNGYKTVPNVNSFDSVFTVASLNPVTQQPDGTYAIVVIEGDLVQAPQAPAQVNYIYFADTAYTTEWNAAANEGKGAVDYIYENVYLNGVKTSVTFTAPQGKAIAGVMYAYTVNAKGVMSIDYSANLLLGTDKVTLIHEDFFVANGVNYVDADTVYYQITKTGLTKVDVLPTVKTTESIVVKYIINNYVRNSAGQLVVTTANTVYFEVVETAKAPAAFALTETNLVYKLPEAGKPVLTGDVSVKFAKSFVVELCDAKGNVIGTLTSKKAPSTYDVLSCAFRMYEYNSSSWTQVWTPDKDEVPAYCNFIVDGVYVASGNVGYYKDQAAADNATLSAYTATTWEAVLTPAV